MTALIIIVDADFSNIYFVDVCNTHSTNKIINLIKKLTIIM